MFWPADARNDQVQIVKLSRIDFDKRAREKISLFLVVSLEHDTVAADDNGFEGINNPFTGKHRALHPWLYSLHAPSLLIATRCPGTERRLCGLRCHRITSLQKIDCPS